jgi:sugar phosphate isomerase/epimerase
MRNFSMITDMYKVSFQTNCYTWVPRGYTGLYPGTGYTLDYALRNLAEIGYDGVEIDCAHILDTRLWTISKAQRRDLRNAVTELGIEVESFSAHEWPLQGVSFTSSDPETRKLGMEWTKNIIDLAADFGTKIVTTHVPSPRARCAKLLPGMPRGFFKSTNTGDWGRTSFQSRSYTEEEQELVMQSVGECADYCRDRDVLFAIEEYSPDDYWKEFIKQVGSPALKINLHIGAVWRHMYGSNGVIKEASLPDAVHSLGDLIVHTHCMDYRRVADTPVLDATANRPTLEVMPGAGECDFVGFIRALKEVGYNGYLTVECHRSDITPEIQASQALQNMRRLVRQAFS